MNSDARASGDRPRSRQRLHAPTAKRGRRLATLLVALAALAQPTVVQAQVDPALAARLQSTLDASVRAEGWPGASAAVILPDGGAWLGTSGYSVPATGDTIRPDMLFGIGSITQTYIAATVLKLAEEGILSLDDPIDKWIPPFEHVDGAITIRQLLNHTSGVFDYRYHPFYSTAMQADFTRFWSPEDILGQLVRAPYFAPGEDHRYSDTDYLLAGMVIKEATGGDVSTVLHTRFLDPQGLTSTFLGAEEEWGEVAHPWSDMDRDGVLDDLTVVPWTSNLSLQWTAAGMLATAADVARFAGLLYSGALLSRASTDELLSVRQMTPSSDLKMATAFRLIYRGRTLWVNPGGVQGYTGMACYLPAHDASLAVLGNQSPSYELPGPVMEALLGAYLDHAVGPKQDVVAFDGGEEEDWTWHGHGQTLTRITDHSASDAAASWSPDGTRLCFHTDRDGNREVYAIGTDGSDPVNLTRHPASDGWPAWSPDGARIAFHTERDRNLEVYVMDADGSNPVNLTRDGGKDLFPAWSPDGSRIAFVSERDGNREIYVMDADGGHPTNLTNNDARDSYPSWSPDGTRIAFVSDRGEYPEELYVLDLQSGETTHVALGCSYSSAWSPDGRQIVVASPIPDGNWEIYLVDVDTGELTNVSRHPGYDEFPTWSPDGHQIVFTSGRTGNNDLFILNLDDASELTLDPAQSETTFSGSAALAVRSGAYEWSLRSQPPEPFDPSGYETLRFAFHPGDVSPSPGDELSVRIGEIQVDLLHQGEVDLSATQWQVVELPLETFALNELIGSIEFTGNLTGTFYVDEVCLEALPAPVGTAVAEERGEGLPSTAALQQNYPNPFNPDTVIPFALPHRGSIELAVYNLTGQRVASLVNGVREAGEYTVRWDGRNDEGRQLASGVYLYKLRTEAHVETRKLVLVR